MKAIFKQALTLLGLTSIFAFTGCQDEDFGYTAEQISFNTNFQKEYGKINPEQNWDFYRAMPRTAKFSPWMHGEAETRAGIDGYTPTDPSALIKNTDGDAYYAVLDETLDWMRSNLVEEHNNTSVGESFSLLPPSSNDFAIIPIYVGQHKMDVSLHLVSDGKDYKVWSEWEGTGVQVMDNAASAWRDLQSNENTLSAYAVHSKPILINHEVVTKEFFFYLSIDKGHMKNENGLSGYEYCDGNYAITGTAQRSDEGMMLALGCPIPDNVAYTGERRNEVMIIGCEDSDQADSDWDINDLVFLIVGYPDIPNLVEYTRKRYMCEDLGNTFDFDFNDIVVDVDQEVVKEAKISQDGMIVFEEEPGSRKQYATIKHVCGTLPFQVKVGDFTFNKVNDPTDESRTLQDLGASDTRSVNWNPEVCKKITGWIPEQNNIWITVQDARTNPDDYVFTDLFAASVESENAAEHIYRVNFPKDGTPPMILALDQSVNWMDESVHIPESWWKEGKIFRKTLNLISNPAGAGTFIGAGSYLYGSKVHFSVRANEGFVFTGWSDGNNKFTREITSLNENTTLTANFRECQTVTVSWNSDPVENVTITATVEGQSVSSGTVFTEGTTVHFNTIIENSSLEFSTWKTGDNVVSSRAEFDYVINGEGSSSVLLTAYFAAPWWDVALTTADDGGKNIWSGSQNASGYQQFNEMSDYGGDNQPMYHEQNNGSYRTAYQNLIKALKSGCRYLKFEFDNKATDNFTVRNGSWTEIAKISPNGKSYAILTLTDAQAQSIIDNNGVRIEFQLSNGIQLTNIKAYEESPVTSFTVSVADDGNGTASASVSTVESGDQVTLTATADEGYYFQGWKKTDGTIESTQNPWTFSVTSNVNYTASFAEAQKYTIFVSAGANGSVNTAGGEYYGGTKVTFTATPANGYTVARWTKNNETIAGETKNTLTITVSGDDSYGVEFEETKEATGETTLSANGQFYKLSAMSNISEQATKLTLTLIFTGDVNGVVGILDQYNNMTSTVPFGYSTTSPLSIEITNSALISAAKSGNLYMNSYSNVNNISKIEYKAE